MVIRKATEKDIDLLIKLRLDFLKDYRGDIAQNGIEAVRLQMRRYCEKHILDGSFMAIIAEIDDEAVSTAYLVVWEMPADERFVTGKAGRIMNVYTRPKYRSKGIAKKVMSFLIDEARRSGVSFIDLAATPPTKGLYKKLGFKQPQEPTMRLKLI
jgi:Predicted acetyltransferase